MSSGPDRRTPKLLGAFLASLLLLCVACARLSPEERVRLLIDEAVAAARGGDQAGLGEMISEQYRDPSGMGKPELMALLDFHLCHEESLHLLQRVRSIRQTDGERVEAQILLGAAGVPIEDLANLNRYSADLLVIDAVFVKEERAQWRVIEARWRRAEPADLL